MKLIITMMLLLPALSFASGTQKSFACKKDGEKIINVKPQEDESTFVEFFVNGQLDELLACDMISFKKRYEITCVINEAEGYKTITKITVVTKRDKNKSTFLKTFVSPEGDEILEDFNMNCRRL